MSDRPVYPPPRRRRRSQIERERLLMLAIDRMHQNMLADIGLPADDDRPMTRADRRRIEAIVDQPLAGIYGPSRGQDGELIGTIERATTEAWEQTLIEEAAHEAELLEGRIAAIRAAGDTAFADLLEMSRVGVQARLQMAQALDTARTWIDPNGYVLSDRVWQAGEMVRQRINQELRLAVVRGESPATAAKRIAQYMTPGRDGGTLKGRGLYAANRLARTELARAHAEATLEAGRRIPSARGVRWALGNNHPRVDVCDTHATANEYGHGPGGYPFDYHPTIPAHPHCRCFWTRILPSREQSDEYLIRKYGLYNRDGEYDVSRWQDRSYGIGNPPPIPGYLPPPLERRGRTFQQQLEAEEAVIRRLATNEVAIAYNPVRGTELFRTVGPQATILRPDEARFSLQFSPAQERQLRGAILTHNHPSGWLHPASDPRSAGAPFSVQDLELILHNRMQEIRAVGRTGTYRFRFDSTEEWEAIAQSRQSSGETEDEVAGRQVAEVIAEVIQARGTRYNSRDAGTLDAETMDRVSQLLAERVGAVYERNTEGGERPEDRNVPRGLRS